MEKLITNSISSFHLIELFSTIHVQMVLRTDSEIYKLSMKRGIKEKLLDRIHFLHNL